MKNKIISRPVCPNCEKPCSPSGGKLDGSEMFWTCWDCGYKLDDIQCEIINMEAPNTFRKNGFNYTLVSLGQRSCIYEQTYTEKPPVSYFEVWKIKEQREFKIGGKLIPAKFRIPGNEDFGKWAWTFRDREKALAEFNRLESLPD